MLRRVGVGASATPVAPGTVALGAPRGVERALPCNVPVRDTCPGGRTRVSRVSAASCPRRPACHVCTRGVGWACRVGHVPRAGGRQSAVGAAAGARGGGSGGPGGQGRLLETGDEEACGIAGVSCSGAGVEAEGAPAAGVVGATGPQAGVAAGAQAGEAAPAVGRRALLQGA